MVFLPTLEVIYAKFYFPHHIYDDVLVSTDMIGEVEFGIYFLVTLD